MVKAARHVPWSVLADEEIGESSGTGGKDEKKKQAMHGSDGGETGGGGDDLFQLEPHQINEILQLHNADHPGMQLVTAPLTGVNFLNWSRGIKRALGAKSKLEILDGTLPEPHFTCKYYKQWIKVDYMVSSWITNSISKEIVNSFSHYDTTKKLWDALCRRFDRSNGPKISKLEKEIRTYVQGNLSVMEYFSNLTVLWDEIDMVLPPVDCVCHARTVLERREEERRLVQFLLGLNDSYEQARSQILLMEPLPSIDKAYSMIAQVEDQKSIQEMQGEGRGQMALYAQRQMVYSGPKYGYQHKEGLKRDGSGQMERRISKDEKRKLRCSHCKASGHEAHECFKLHGYPEWYKKYKDTKGVAAVNYMDNHQKEGHHSIDTDKGEGRQQSHNLSNTDMASIIQAEVAKCIGNLGNSGGFTVHPKTDVNMVHGAKESNSGVFTEGHYTFSIVPSMEKSVWIVDSGASTHVCCDKELLHTTYRLDRQVIVNLPDGSIKRVSVAGKVRLNQDIVLSNVLYVPGFTHNLLSVAQLIQENEVKCTFYQSHCVFQTGNSEQVIGIGKMEKNLYVMETVSENHFCHFFREEDMNLEKWHQFLGHPSLSTLQHMKNLRSQFKQEIVEAIKTCKICMRAKQTRDSFPILNRRSAFLFDLVHADVWGPYGEDSVSNTRFVLTLVEDHSRMIWTFLISSKDLVCGILANFI